MKKIKTIHIFKPLFETESGDYVGIYDKEVNDAAAEGKDILIISKNSRGYFGPAWIKKHCPKFKSIMDRPNEPMTLFKVFVPLAKPEEEEFSKNCLR